MIAVSLNFMPAFYHRHGGAAYGEAYYFDPSQRTETDSAEQRLLFELFGNYGVGTPTPSPSTNLFIQPVDVIMRTQGAEWRFPVDGTVESWGKPWENLTPDEIAAIDPRHAAAHPVIDRIIAAYRDLARHHGSKADIFGSKTGTMNIHTPYTTAHQLCGENIFILMALEPDQATRVFEKVWEIYQAVFNRITTATGAAFTAVNMGDCAASMLSEETYRSVILPMNAKIASRFKEATYHSCGSSTHLLEAFAEIPNIAAIQLGPGTSVDRASTVFADARMMPLVDPVMMRDSSTDHVAAETRRLINTLSPHGKATLCAWSFDRDTPIENVSSLLATVHHHKKHYESSIIQPKSGLPANPKSEYRNPK